MSSKQEIHPLYGNARRCGVTARADIGGDIWWQRHGVRALAFFLLGVVLFGTPSRATSQPYYFSHFAGPIGGPGHSDGFGAAGRFALPTGVAVDAAGTLYIADRDNQTIRKVTASGLVTTLAGLPGARGSADGTGTAARFNNPEGAAVDGAETVYVADTGNHTIRKITADGVSRRSQGCRGSLGV